LVQSIFDDASAVQKIHPVQSGLRDEKKTREEEEGREKVERGGETGERRRTKKGEREEQTATATEKREGKRR
jgi:hypothetical protein